MLVVKGKVDGQISKHSINQMFKNKILDKLVNEI